MRRLILAVLVLLPTTVSHSTSDFRKKLVPSEVVRAVSYMQPENDEVTAHRIAEAVYRGSLEIGMDWKLMLSILHQESSLKLNPQGCKVWVSKRSGERGSCVDYGIGQVNFRTWGKSMNLSRLKLVTSYEYSIEAPARILKHYKKLYGKHGHKWYLRYHSGKPEHKRVYDAYVTKRYVAVKRYVSGLKRGER